jgi:hypothetical protein
MNGFITRKVPVGVPGMNFGETGIRVHGSKTSGGNSWVGLHVVGDIDVSVRITPAVAKQLAAYLTVAADAAEAGVA